MPPDVLVVGAGPAGALAATLLARAGVRVRLIDRARFPRAKLCGDSINPGALALLGTHVPAAAIAERGLAIDGMLLTGPGGVTIRGEYGHGVTGRTLSRHDLDAMLLAEACAAGAQFDDRVVVRGPRVAGGGVTGVDVRLADGRSGHHPAALVIAADGRTSRLARSLKLARHPRWPRRWAIGAYFANVHGLARVGEMHLRAGHYLGVAPLPGGIANACLVTTPEQSGAWRDPAGELRRALTADPMLAPRFADARMLAPPQVLGPMATDVSRPGVAGLLLAGDAGGFIDPMTGDGLRLALASAELTARIALQVLDGTVSRDAAVRHLARARRRAFRAKWRFNRVLRRLVASPGGLGMAAMVARRWPAPLNAVIRYAGDCPAPPPARDVAAWATAR